MYCSGGAARVMSFLCVFFAGGASLPTEWGGRPAPGVLALDALP